MSLFKIAVVGACLLCFAPFAAKAESTEPYPRRMIRYVVPFPPGATSDSVGRIIAQRLSEVLGQTVVVENKPGAGTALAAEMVARAEPDGYTLFNVTNATLAAIPHLMKLTYDAETAFAPVALTGDLYSYLAVNPDLPVADFAQFVAHAKANSGKLNFGSAGNGSPQLGEPMRFGHRQFPRHVAQGFSDYGVNGVYKTAMVISSRAL